MQRAAIPLGLQQTIVVLIPAIAALIAVLVVYPSWRVYRATLAKIEAEKARYATLSASLAVPHDPFRAAEEDTEAEPSQFLGYVSALVRESGCQLVGMDAQGEGARDANLRTLNSRLSVRGTYGAVRSLVYRIRRADRLLTIRDLSIRQESTRSAAAYPLVAADLTIQRFVAVPAGTGTPAPAAAPAPPNP